MKLLKPLGRWTVTTLHGMTLAAAVLGTANLAVSQTPSAANRAPAALPKRIYTKTVEFKLPIQMDEKTRAQLDRVCLYVKSGTADWVRQEMGPANMPYFLYRVPQDGEYWFNLTTIDKTGRMNPADVSQETPALRVIVDTKAPILDVHAWTSPDGETCLRCNVIDGNADPASLKAVAKLPGSERALLPHPSHPGVFRTGGTELLSASVVVTATDLCGNAATREIQLRELLAAAAPAQPALGSTSSPQTLLPAPVTVSANKTDLPSVPNTDLPPPPALPTLPAPDPTTVMLPPAPPVILPATQTTVLNSAPNLRPELDPLPRPPVVANSAPPASNKQIINTPRAILDYRIDQVGPSGVGKVQVFMTTDPAQSWQRLGEDSDRRSPIEFDLPGEGLFGIRLAVTNGNGFGGTPPQRGDAPTCWIEVDTSAPFVQLRPIDPVVNSGTLEIRWQATDKNLGPEPVNLYYRSRIDGPWQVIARGVKNDGVHRWAFPRDVAAQFFIKVEVTDLAGNTSRVETPNPVVLDMTEPHATVLGVSGMSVRPGGN